ncbi:MAG: phospho-sugar mutase [Clostridia bacterium]|nr:phospho-sugar mutase [Clostridia bacterium]
MNNIRELYDLWVEKTANDAEIHKELEKIRDNEDEILDRFYRNLEFGTAGLRGVLGAGTNRMNKYTVGQATQGLANYLNDSYQSSSVAIGYDSRINSDVFAKLSASILAANGIKVYLYSRLMPTPMISYAVMRLGCKSGIVITASHNPSKYNGYKCYDPAGYQMTEEAAAKTYSFICGTDMFDGVRYADFDGAVASGMIEYISDDIIEEYYGLCLKTSINPDVIKKSDVSIIYSPLNGTGNIPVRTVLDRAGFKDIRVVREQEQPDGTFPTCPYPNPEIKQVFECGLEMAKERPADLLLATDPDCDRVGIAVNTKDGYRLLSGNDVGNLLTYYMLSQKKANGVLPANPIVVRSFVSTKLVDRICNKYGATLVETLTGFKYIGEKITQLEEENRKSDFIIGFEESYGYLVGTHAKDKDAVAASLLICEMTAYFKEQGKNLAEVLESLYEEYGYCSSETLSFVFEGADGMTAMADIMSKTAKNPPEFIGKYKVLRRWDYNTGEVIDTETGETGKITLPKSNVLAFGLPDGNYAIVRPSGTEPKIKVYLTGTGKNEAEAAENIKYLGEEMKKLLGIK